ncbi:MAG: phenylacetic acid degradation bifunctional protein PaaZ, partial [Gemmatimonadales bacterium]
MGQWVEGAGEGAPLVHAVTGAEIGRASSDGLDFKGMLEYGARTGGRTLRQMTFHQRAALLKAMAKYLMERKEEFYELSAATGATRIDSWIDIEGGIGTFFAYSSRGRRDLPNETFYVDGEVEALSKGGTFMGRHICVPLEGTAIHINAFNFPCWGMLEKLAPTFLAGMPAIVKPATVTSFLTQKMVAAMIESGILPDGALQLICGGAGDLLDHVACQDVVTFTGSAWTGRKLKSHPRIVAESVRFNMEADSLNCCILGPDAEPGSEEFDLFIKEVVREMTVKAGQKCTAIRRTIVPEGRQEAVIEALTKRLGGVKIGDPSVEGVKMGPLAGRAQVGEVRKATEQLMQASEVVFGSLDQVNVTGADAATGAFFPLMLLHCADPLGRSEPHDIEAFGPVNTVMPYRDLGEAVELARRGKGSLCGSLFTADPAVAREVVLGVAPWHGRILVLDRSSAKESTGHGSPLPYLIHGGPGRAGGGEEMGGVRGVLHFMQRAAIQGHPTMLTAITGQWSKGAAQHIDAVHPFRKHFEELQVGETLVT